MGPGTRISFYPFGVNVLCDEFTSPKPSWIIRDSVPSNTSPPRQHIAHHIHRFEEKVADTSRPSRCDYDPLFV